MARWIFARFLFVFVMAADSWLWGESRTLPDPPSSPVTRQEIWQAVVAELRQRGLSEQQLPQAEDLDLPVALPALAGRRVRVSSACWDEGPQREQFRMECDEPGQCLPFLVYLRNSVPGPGAYAVSCRRATSGLTRETQPKPAVRAGDRATAVFVADRLRMTTRVTCLERGREGEVIRVRSLDGHIFRARISRVSYQGIALAVETRRP